LMDEFEKYKKDFLEKFIKQYKNCQYIISPESAGKEISNHYQIVLVLNKPIRQDSMKRTIVKFIGDVANPKVALVVNGITRDLPYAIGYALKEHEDYNEMIIKGFTDIELLNYKEYYKKKSSERKDNINKFRVSKKNLPLIVKNYISNHKEELNKAYSTVYETPMVFPEPPNIKLEHIKICLGLMGQQDYQMYGLMISREYTKIVELLKMYLNDKLIYWDNCNHSQDVIDADEE